MQPKLISPGQTSGQPLGPVRMSSIRDKIKPSLEPCLYCDCCLPVLSCVIFTALLLTSINNSEFSCNSACPNGPLLFKLKLKLQVRFTCRFTSSCFLHLPSTMDPLFPFELSYLPRDLQPLTSSILFWHSLSRSFFHCTRLSTL